MDFNVSSLSKSARRKFLRYGKVPKKFCGSSLSNIKLTKDDLEFHMNDSSQQRQWKKLELYGNYKKDL
jgi:hypothetical protein